MFKNLNKHRAALENERQYTEHFLGKLENMKIDSKTMKQNRKQCSINTFWLKGLKTMQADQKKQETELGTIYSYIDSDKELLELLSNNEITVNETIEDQDTKRAIVETNQWYQVENLRKINRDLSDGVNINERAEEQIEQVSDVQHFFGQLSRAYENELENFNVENGEYQYERVLDMKNNALVKGFDIEEEVNLDLLIEEEELLLIEEEERKMVSNYYYTFDLLREQYQLEMERIRDKDLEDPFSQKGGVPKFQKDCFCHFKLLNIRFRRPREELMILMIDLFEGLSRLEWEAYDSYWEHNKWQGYKKKAMLREFVREQKRLKAKTEGLIAEHLQAKTRAMSLQEEHLAQKEKIEELHDKLEEKRRLYYEKQDKVEKAKDQEFQAKFAEMEKKAKQFERYARVVKEQVGRYKTEKDMAERNKARAQSDATNKILNEKRRMIVLAKPSVKSRQEMEKVKMIKAKNEVFEKQVLREERVRRIKQAVDCYKSRPEPEANFDRMVGDTVAHQYNKNAVRLKPLFRNDVIFLIFNFYRGFMLGS